MFIRLIVSLEVPNIENQITETDEHDDSLDLEQFQNKN